MKIKILEKSMKKAEILYLCVYKSILINLEKNSNDIFKQFIKN